LIFTITSLIGTGYGLCFFCGYIENSKDFYKIDNQLFNRMPITVITPTFRLGHRILEHGFSHNG
jgi:methenyltetrahydromethanopterin cyclohydrolase